VGEAEMGHVDSGEAGVVFLEGRQEKTSRRSTDDDSIAASEMDGSDGKTKQSVLPDRLSDKMSKIMSETADITKDSKTLQERNDQP
jgi:hypothetical protein